MFKQLRPVLSLLAGVSLLLLGSGLLNTLLAVRGSEESFSDQAMGLIMSGYFVGFFVGTFLALPLIRRVGHIRTFAMCAAVGSVSVLLHDAFATPWAWGGLRVLTGTALVILYTVIESWLNATTPPQNRGQVFAVYMVVNLGALAVSQQFMSLAPASSYLLFALASVLVTLSLVPVTGTRFGPPEVQQVKRLGIRFLWRIAPLAISAAFLSGLAMGAFWGMSALYASRIGLPTSEVATFVTSGIIGGALLQYPVGRLSDRFDRRRVLAGIVGVAAVSALLIIPASFASVEFLYAAIALYGGLAFAVYPVAVAHLIDHLESGDILPGGSALLLVHGIGAAIGPALSGQLMSMTGASALPVYFAAVQGTLFMVAVWKMHQRQKDETTGEPAQFVPMVRTTPTALEMHPDDSEQSPDMAPDVAHGTSGESDIHEESREPPPSQAAQS